MPLSDKLYRWLATGPTPDCDGILAAALEHAEAPWATQIIQVLLERGRDASWAAMICSLDKLPADVRAAVLADRDKFCAGVAMAVKSHAAAGRRNALAAFEAQPEASLIYLLPDALRDAVAEVRAAAGHALRSTLAEFLTTPPPTEAEPDELAGWQAARREFVTAVQEAVRTFDLHHRGEALESALWLASDVGEALWSLLENHKSRAAVVVQEHLVGWDHPRLAGFLIESLRRAAWRSASLDVLRTWKTHAHLVELLRVTPLLDDTEIATHVTSIKGTELFAGLDEGLENIPENLRAFVPRWLRHIGPRDGERVRLLQRWAAAPSEPLRRAAVYTLAELDGDEPLRALRELAEGKPPLAVFARWCVLSRNASLVRTRPTAPGAETRTHGCRQRVAPEQEIDVDHDFATLWQACRRSKPADRGEWLAILRDHAEVWHRRLRMLMRSPDGRDRVLVLQVVSTPELALMFRHDLQTLASDPVAGIRKLTQALLSTSAAKPVAARKSDDKPGQPRTAENSEARSELDELMTQLARSEGSAGDALIAGRIRQLLRIVNVSPRREAAVATVEHA